LDRIYLCWFPKYKFIHTLILQLDLDQLIGLANAGDKMCQARLMKINWITQHLREHDVQKPIVVDSNNHVIVGDNRLTALALLQQQRHVPVLQQCSSPQGTVVDRLDLLPHLTGLINEPQISWKPLAANPIREKIVWFDIGDRSTADITLDYAQCMTAIDLYLQKYPNTRFNTHWCKQPIDWSEFMVDNPDSTQYN
jgi:hypothetical protein